MHNIHKNIPSVESSLRFVIFKTETKIMISFSTVDERFVILTGYVHVRP